MRWRAALLALALAGCASTPAQPPAGRGTLLTGSIEIDGRAYRAHWTLPPGEAHTLVVIEHGFARFCGNLAGTTLALVETGAMALCLDATMARGNGPLARALAAQLGALKAPDGRTMPTRVVAAGHSAGAVFALEFGASLEETEPGRLAGALLFDPVLVDGSSQRLERIAAGGRPVLALLAVPHRCNAMGSARPALAGLAEVVDGAEGSTHIDAEGEDSDALARSACGEPRVDLTQALRAKAAQWLRDLAGR